MRVEVRQGEWGNVPGELVKTCIEFSIIARCPRARSTYGTPLNWESWHRRTLTSKPKMRALSVA